MVGEVGNSSVDAGSNGTPKSRAWQSAETPPPDNFRQLTLSDGPAVSEALNIAVRERGYPPTSRFVGGVRRKRDKIAVARNYKNAHKEL